MKIKHDPQRCAILGICEELAPSLFEVSEDGDLVVLNAHPDESQFDQARAAAAGCPTGAITVVED